MVNASRSAIVTGGGQGIGKCTARMLLENGFRVMIADADKEAGYETESEYAPYGDIIFVPTDVAQENEVQGLMERVEKEFGRLDLLVNNAGLIKFGPVASFPLAEWHRIIDTNLTGAFLCAKYAATLLKTSGGSIVNIASTHALMSDPGNEAYGASKAGLIGLTHALAMSLGPEVRVNCISPGWIDVAEWKKMSARKDSELRPQDHKQHPVGRAGVPEDIASMIVHLSGPQAGFITGANFVIDGGMTRKMIYD